MNNYDGGIMILKKPDDTDLCVYKIEFTDRKDLSCEEHFGVEGLRLYMVYAIHQIDGFGDSTVWCQDCMDSLANAPESPDGYTTKMYSGKYGEPADWRILR